MNTTPIRVASAFLSALSFMTLAYSQAPAPAAAANAANKSAAPTALKSVDRLVGTGAVAEKMTPVLVHYTGYLWDASKPDNKGEAFDTSTGRPLPFGFMLGAGRVIKGWDEGVIGMKVGGQRTLVIPAELAYGAAGSPPKIPPNAALIFDIELMGVIGKTQQPKAEPSAYVPLKSDAKK